MLSEVLRPKREIKYVDPLLSGLIQKNSIFALSGRDREEVPDKLKNMNTIYPTTFSLDRSDFQGLTILKG